MNTSKNRTPTQLLRKVYTSRDMRSQYVAMTMIDGIGTISKLGRQVIEIVFKKGSID